MSGRTTWWPKDAAWHRRERQVQLGVDMGADAVHVLDVLCCWAQEQRSPEGFVRGGFTSLAREAFVDVERVRQVVGFAAGIGALDELELDPDGRRFTCRISGWESDMRRGSEAIRKAGQRAHAAENTDDPDSLSHSDGTCPTEKGLVPLTKPNQTKEEKTPAAASQPVVAELFAYWQSATKHPQAKPTKERLAKIAARLQDGYTAEQIKRAIDGAARAAFVNDQGKRFDDIELICRNGSKLEGFIDRADLGPPSTGVVTPFPRKPSPSDLLRQINGGSAA